MVASGNDVVVSWSTVATEIDKSLVAMRVGIPVSVACTVKFDVPALVGVPEMTPVDASIVSPSGNEPALTDQAYAGAPPVASTGTEYADPTMPPGNDVVVNASASTAVTVSDHGLTQ